MKNLLILGAPGSGKGTQASLISKILKIPTISTGNLLRENIAKKTRIGKEANEYVSKGQLVPDSIMDKMIENVLNSEECKNGFLLDGYPRTLEQVKKLNSMLIKKEKTIDAVIELYVSESLIIERLLKRAEIENRKDDTKEIIIDRLQVYRNKTVPVLSSYAKNKTKHIKIDGSGNINEITDSIIEHFSK